MIDLVRDNEQKLDEEQAVMDDHEDKVAKITEHLQQLGPESKAASLRRTLWATQITCARGLTK